MAAAVFVFTAGIAFAAPADARLETFHATKKTREGNAARIAKLLGRYRFAGDKREIEALDAAIDDAVSDMNIFVREIARRRLRRITEIPKTLGLSVHEGVLTVGVPNADYSAPLDGTPVKVKGPTGDMLTLRHDVIETARLRQSFFSEDGSRVNLCEIDNKERLRVHVRIRSEKLSKDLTYSLTFARKS